MARDQESMSPRTPSAAGRAAPTPKTAAHKLPTRVPVAKGPAGAGQAPLLRCTAGPHVLLFDLRTLQHIDYVDVNVPLLPSPADGAAGAGEVDLRVLLGADCGPQQALLYTLPPDPTLRRLVVDAGSLRLLRIDLARLVPMPTILARMPALRAVRATVALEGDVLGWLVDPSRLPGVRGG
jgi:hypothetical protein